jgi:hypothetical protein
MGRWLREGAGDSAWSGGCRIEKRLRRSQIFIDPDAKKEKQLRWSDICLETLVTFGCIALDVAPNGADRVYVTVL